jgi:hypothetical protein
MRPQQTLRAKPRAGHVHQAKARLRPAPERYRQSYTGFSLNYEKDTSLNKRVAAWEMIVSTVQRYVNSSLEPASSPRSKLPPLTRYLMSS